VAQASIIRHLLLSWPDNAVERHGLQPEPAGDASTPCFAVHSLQPRARRRPGSVQMNGRQQSGNGEPAMNDRKWVNILARPSDAASHDS